ncbi:MAG TPA: MFS transporter [Candidatus Xenobia bacterium]|jgi:MFS family permease
MESDLVAREADLEARHPPAWIFGITNIPFGVAGTYSGVAMPFFLRSAGLPVKEIAALTALALVPSTWQFLWAPVLDLWIPRRFWLVLVSILGGVCLGMSLEVSLPQHIGMYTFLVVAGQALTGLVGSCNGALVSTTLPERLRDTAAGWVNAANLGAAALGGGLVMTLVGHSAHLAAVGLVIMVVAPSLAALSITEDPPSREPLLKHLGEMGRHVWIAVKSRRGWTGLLFCISPVGTVALGNLFSALGPDYMHGLSKAAGDNLIALVNGYLGSFITAGGCLATGFLLKRVNRRTAYLMSGVLTALVAGAMSLFPSTPTTFVVGVAVYLLVTGLAYTAFSAVVYEIVGTASQSASALYSVFPAVGNTAIVYTLALDGLAQDRWGVKGPLWADAALNVLGVCALLLLLRVVFPETKSKSVVLIEG